jgi:hypothetical protein
VTSAGLPVLPQVFSFVSLSTAGTALLNGTDLTAGALILGRIIQCSKGSS